MTPNELRDSFLKKGWVKFPWDRLVSEWVQATLPIARATLSAPENQQWHRYQGTWFAGVNVLPNDKAGAVAGGKRLTGHAVDFVRHGLGIPDIEWEPAQISVCYPGYPKPMEGESDALHRFRRDRDAAHVDGLLREGPERRRYLREHHAFILGIPMVKYPSDAAPFVVWEGSHHEIKKTFREVYARKEAGLWGQVDVTDAYMSVRKRLFEACPRHEIWAQPGEAYIVHRLALHGMAPWPEPATSGPDGRMIAYFRPEYGGPEHWLNAP